MSDTLGRSVIQLRHGYSEPSSGQLEPYEVGYVSSPNRGYLVIGTSEGGITPVKSKIALSAIEIGDANGTPISMGGDTNPIYLKNGKFVACSGASFSGTIDMARSWAQATSVVTNLSLQGATQLQGGESAEVGIGISGILPVANGGTGSSTKAGAISQIINGQTITPNKVRIDNGSTYKHFTNEEYGLHLYNNDIIGLHGLYFQSNVAHTQNNASRGIHFSYDGNANDDPNWDSIYAVRGKLYFAPNHPKQATTSDYREVFFDGGSGGELTSTLTISRDDGDLDRDSSKNKPSLIVKDGYYQLLFDGNEIFSSREDKVDEAQLLWVNGNLAIPPVAWGTAAPSESVVGAPLSNGTIYFQVVS